MILDDPKDFLATIDLPILWLDGALRLVHFTPEAAVLFGFSERARGQSLEEIPVSEAFRPLSAVAAAVRESGTVDEREVTSSDGRWFQVRTRSFREGPGGEPGVVITLIDITTHKETDRTLRGTEERWRRIREIDSVGILFFDFEGNFFEANDAFLQMAGADRESLVRGELKSERFTLPEWMPRTRQAFAELRETGRLKPYEKQLIRPDGTRWWGLFAGTQIEENLAVEFVVDVTDRRRAEEARSESEERLRAVMDTSPDPIFLKDRSSRLLLANRATFEVIGKPPEDCLGKTDAEFYDDAEAGAAVMENDRRIMATEQTQVIEERIPVGNHWRIYLTTKAPFRDAAGEVIGTVGVARDITERKQTEQALRVSEARYRTLFDSIDEGFCVMEILFDEQERGIDHRFLEINPAFERHTGLVGAVGKTARELVPDLESEWPERYGRVAMTGEPDRFVDHSEAMNRWFEGYAFRIGEPAQRRVALLFTDVTQRKRSEQALAESHNLLEHRVAERTAKLIEQRRRLQHLARDLAAAEHQERKRLAALLHDGLQQDLVAATMHLFLAREQEGAELEAALDECMRLVDQALDASRNLTRELRPPVLYESGLIAALRWLADDMGQRHHLSVEVGLGDQRTPLQEDVRAMLFEAVRELLFNAVKHAQAREAVVDYQENGEELRISVRDRGAGFDLDEAEQRKRHIGLGLFSIRERLETFDGAMEIETAPGEGTQVTLRLPLAMAAEGTNATAQVDPTGEVPRPANPPPQPSAPGVLVVDDHAIVRQGMVNLLARDPRLHIVGEAGDGIEALSRVEEWRPAVVLMDVNLPRLNGIEATRRIRQSWPEVQVVGLSVQDDPATRQEMLEAGASAFISKNGKAEDLLQTVLHACTLHP